MNDIVIPKVTRFLSDKHFSVDGTLVEAWASIKSFRAKDGSDVAAWLGRNVKRHFHHERQGRPLRAASVACLLFCCIIDRRHSLRCIAAATARCVMTDKLEWRVAIIGYDGRQWVRYLAAADPAIRQTETVKPSPVH